MPPRLLFLRCLAAALIGASLGTNAAPSTRWMATDLTGMTVLDVNGQGKVVGIRDSYEGRYSATMYSAGTYTALAPSAYSSGAFSISGNGTILGMRQDSSTTPARYANLTPGGTGRDAGFNLDSWVGVVNDRGDIAGTTPVGNFDQRAFLSRSDGTAFAIGPLNSYVLDMNNQGTVIGRHDNDFAKDRSFVTTRDGASQYLPSLGGTSSLASDINDRGQIVGSSQLYGDATEHATLYENGALHDLGTLVDGGLSYARAINEHGQVVGGASATVGGVTHAFLYENGVMKDLGTLGGRSAAAWDINNLGQVLGFSQTGIGDEYDYFLYELGRMINLNDLVSSMGNWDVRGAALADNGYIAGRAVDRSTGYEHSFLLQLAADDGGSLPEPASLLLAVLAMGAAGTVRLAARKRGSR